MSCFRVAQSTRDFSLIEVGYHRATRGLHIERARLSDRHLRRTCVEIAREANHRMIAAMRAAKGTP